MCFYNSDSTPQIQREGTAGPGSFSGLRYVRNGNFACFYMIVRFNICLYMYSLDNNETRACGTKGASHLHLLAHLQAFGDSCCCQAAAFVWRFFRSIISKCSFLLLLPPMVPTPALKVHYVVWRKVFYEKNIFTR